MAEIIDASGAQTDRVDLAVVLKTFAERKLLRVLSEGGPGMISLLIEHGLLDELCMTIAPILVGGQARRIATGDGRSPHPDAAEPPAHRRRGLPLHALRQGRVS